VLSQDAFEELYRTEARPLWTYVYRVIGNVADTDDLVQDAFCRLLQADVGWTDRRRTPALPISDCRQPHDRRLGRERARSRDEPERVIEPAAPHDDVTKTFGRLKPRERALLWLAYVEHETHAEIADRAATRAGLVVEGAVAAAVGGRTPSDLAPRRGRAPASPLWPDDCSAAHLGVAPNHRRRGHLFERAFEWAVAMLQRLSIDLSTP
jgi:DNA-directed RNA polymerase specialized sigma24 family protein